MFSDEFREDFATGTESRLVRMFEERCESMCTQVIEQGMASQVCESPIENLMASAFFLSKMANDFCLGAEIELVGWHPPRLDLQGLIDHTCRFDCIYVAPQVEVRKIRFSYRVDFLAMAIFGGNSRKLAIECDGHAFHEKTKEQAQRDKERDRALLSYGIPVMRFTGAEIWKDPMKCVGQVGSYFEQFAVEEFYRQHAQAGVGV